MHLSGRRRPIHRYSSLDGEIDDDPDGPAYFDWLRAELERFHAEYEKTGDAAVINALILLFYTDLKYPPTTRPPFPDWLLEAACVGVLTPRAVRRYGALRRRASNRNSRAELQRQLDAVRAEHPEASQETAVTLLLEQQIGRSNVTTKKVEALNRRLRRHRAKSTDTP